MAKLVTKFKYLKPNARQHVGGYAKYIATREGVDKIDESYQLAVSTKKQQKLIEKILRDFPDTKEMLEYEDYQKDPTVGNASEFITRALEDNAYEVMQTKTYADYIATRPRAQRFGTHGLFTDAGVEVKLDQVSDELNHYGGNVWTIIISLRREDAERLGYNTGERWRDMLRTQTAALADNFKIPMENLKWYAAFHSESHHPHVHLMVYADEGIKPYLSNQGVTNLRSSFARDIFAQDLLCVYEKQTEHRNELRAQSRELLAEIISRVNTGTYDNPRLEKMLLQLAGRLSKTGGKKQYGYLKADVKAIVNSVVKELASEERIAALYDLWYEQKEETIRTYTQELPERVPLADNPEFKSIRNAVIEEAMNIAADRVAVDDVELFVKGKGNAQNANSPMQWLEGDAQLDDGEDGLMGEPIEPDVPIDTESDIGLAFPEHSGGKAAKLDNPDALYGLGRLYLREDFPEHDGKQAVVFLIRAAQKGHDYAAYSLGKLFLLGEKVSRNADYALRWLEQSCGAENPSAEYLLGKTLLYGAEDVWQDSETGLELLERAIRHGNLCAACLLGKAYLEGSVLVSDTEKGLSYLTTAADQGFSSAEYLLGRLLYEGEGMAQDIPKALRYLASAAEKENPYAACLAGKILLTEDTVKDVLRAIRYFEIAAEQGNDFAQYQLGRLYLYGKEVERDQDKAISYLTAAAGGGNQYAAQLLSSMKDNRNWSAALGAIRLLHHISRIIQNRLEDERKGGAGGIDRKLKRKIDEKKQAHGLRQG